MKATDFEVIDGAVVQGDSNQEDFLYGGDELSNMMSRAGLMKRTKDVDKEETIAIATLLERSTALLHSKN